MTTFTDKEIKDALNSHENIQTPRFRTFHILGKRIEDVVQNSTKLWKTIFNIVDLDSKEENVEEVKEKEEEEKDEKEKKEEQSEELRT